MTRREWDDPIHFEDQRAFRSWLSKNHDRRDEVWVGFYKKATGKGGLTYKEAVDECLCWGWIDGLKKRVDDERYTHRLTPRRETSKWSDSNLRRYAELEEAGRIADPGRAARERFDPSAHAPYSFETGPKKLSPELAARFEADGEAWSFFRKQPPYYRKTATFWVMSAKRESTRARRLDKLMTFSAAGERLPEISGGASRSEP